MSICLAVQGNNHVESGKKKPKTHSVDGEDRTQTTNPVLTPGGSSLENMPHVCQFRSILKLVCSVSPKP